MIDILFVALTVLYLWFGSKVDQWTTIALLGFKMEVPQALIDHPRAYHLIRSALLLAATACLFATQEIPWYVGAVMLGAAWFATTFIGQRRAFATYRSIWQEAVADPGSAPEEKRFGAAEANRSDAELRDRVMKANRSLVA